MVGDPKRTADIDYLKILARKMQTVPAWRDMALACNEVLGQEIDTRRRRLEKIRDSVKYRRGDTLANFDYILDVDRPAISEITGQPIVIPDRYNIEKGVVKNVIRNLALYSQPNGTDYLDVSFIFDSEPCRWLKPINITQERDALLKNSYIMGFDFFNTKLNDEDLQRLYETIQQYWPESGSDDNFIKFIGFIKNTKFDLVALWSEDSPEYPADNPNNEYPYLEPFNKTTIKSVIDGGNHWQTSHVEITYDLAQFRQFYTLNLDDMEQLFYYFAPIILVLERITGHLTVETPIYGMNVVDTTIYQESIYKPITNFLTKILAANVADVTIINGGFINTKDNTYLGYQSVPLNEVQNVIDITPALIAMGV